MRSRICSRRRSPINSTQATTTAFSVATSTAPAAMSLANFAFGWYSSVTKSTVASIAELNISAISTMEMVNSSTSISRLSRRNSSPISSTSTTLKKWKRIWRWVRTTATMPSSA
jgi:hypothetical protein